MDRRVEKRRMSDRRASERRIEKLTGISRFSGYVFVFAALLFSMSLMPISYSAGYLAGAAGASSGEPPSASVPEINFLQPVTIIVGAIAGIVSMTTASLAAFFGYKKSKLELEMRKIEIDAEKEEREWTAKEGQRQQREIEELKFEIERIKQQNNTHKEES